MFEEILARGWDDFIARTTGPLRFRFILQPLVAALLAVRAGIRDGRENKPAFFWAILTHGGRRGSLLRESFRDVGRVFVFALVLDFIYQVSVQRGVYLLELLFTATTLAFAPYLIIRGPVGRIVAWASKSR